MARQSDAGTGDGPPVGDPITEHRVHDIVLVAMENNWAVIEAHVEMIRAVIEKVLRSAVANAEQKELGDSDSMRVSKAFVNCGPIYKRFRARSAPLRPAPRPSLR